MKAFHFRLESVLKLRQYAEKQQKDALGREMLMLHRLEEEGKKLAEADRIWSGTCLSLCKKGTGPAEMMRIQTYLSELRKGQTENRRRQKTQSNAVEQARTALMEKVKDRKMLDALYEKQLLAYHDEEKKQAENEIIDLLSTRLKR